MTKQTCTWDKPRGWWCSRHIFHGGPCALRPKWWNLVDRVRFGGR